MRKVIIAAAAVVLLAGGAAGARWAYHRFFRDPMVVAQELLAKGQIQAAALELRRVVQQHPDNARAQVRLAAVQLLLGDPVAAERELRIAQKEGYKGTELVPLLARTLLEQKRAWDLLADFSPDGLPPADAANLWVIRGMAELSLGMADAARGSAEAAERLAPKLAPAVLLAARVAVAQRQPGWALALLDRALTLKPGDTESLLLKAGILRAEARPADAMPVLDEAVARATVPRYALEAHLSRAGALLAAGEDAKALVDLNAVLTQAPRNPGANYLKLLAQVRVKDWKGADATLDVIQPLLPRLPRGEYYQALVKTNIGQPEQAQDAIGHYTAHFPRDPDGWRLVARIDLATGHKNEALRALAKLSASGSVAADEAALANRAETPLELTQLASLQINAGNVSAAAQDLDRSLETMPSPAEVAARAVTFALREGNVDRAAAALKTLSEQPRTSPTRLAALTGAVRLAQIDLDGARKAFEEGLKIDPGSVPLKLDLARVLVLLGKPADAEALLAPELAAAPANPAVLGTLLDIYAALGETGRGRAAIAAARAAQPHDPGLLLTDATFAARQGDVAGALAILAAGGDTFANAPQFLALRLRLLAAEKKLPEAIGIARRLQQALPSDPGVRRQLVDLLLADKQGGAAVEAAAEGVKAFPGNLQMMQAYVAATFQASGIDTALRLAEQLRKDPANLPDSQLLKGEVYLAAKRPADAAAAFAAERAATPSGRLMLAEVAALNAAGQSGQARAKLTEWVAHQADPTASDALASMDIQAKNYQAAAAALKDVLAGRPDDVVALNNLAWVDMMLHDPKAEPLAHRAYLLAPGGQTADTLGWILTRDGRPEVGVVLLRQAAAQLPADPSVHYHLAVALNGIGQRDQAGALLKALVAPSVHFDEKNEAQALLQQLGTSAQTQ